MYTCHGGYEQPHGHPLEEAAWIAAFAGMTTFFEVSLAQALAPMGWRPDGALL
jgi:hypothetical protein